MSTCRAHLLRAAGPAQVLHAAVGGEGALLARGAGIEQLGRQLARLPQENGARDVAWSPDGQQVATVSYEQAYVWDVASGRKLLTLDPGDHNGFTAVESVAWAPDSKRLAVGYEDGAIKLWAADSGRSLGELNAFTSSMYSLAWSPDGQWLASASGSDLQVWE